MKYIGIYVILSLFLLVLFSGCVTQGTNIIKPDNNPNNNNLSNNITSCKDNACFDAEFAKCTPNVDYIATTSFADFSYHINGLKTDSTGTSYCEIVNEYIKNPNPQWQNVKMTCLYDHKLLLDDSLKDVFKAKRCSGDLADLMFKDNPQVIEDDNKPVIIKTGCTYNNPVCGSTQECINNQCITKTGCLYKNPDCNSDFICSDNICILKTGCNYNNPICSNNDECINNSCILKQGCKYNNPQCPNNEECVNNECKSKLKYELNDWSNIGAEKEYNVKVGDVIPLNSEDLYIATEYIRVETVDSTNKVVSYTIWAKQQRTCALLDYPDIRLSLNMSEYRFKEFVNSFIYLESIDSNVARIIKYTGKVARDKCLEVVADYQKALACSFYPDNSGFFVENNLFRVYFNKESQQKNAENILTNMQICYNNMISKTPEITANSQPANQKWMVVPYLEENPIASADHDRISIPKSHLNDFSDSTSCYSIFSHELTHVIFGKTILQRVYAPKGTTTYPKSDIDYLGEGFADFYSKYSNDRLDDAMTNICGKDGLLWENQTNSNDLKYKNITNNNYSNIMAFYQTGECFYRRILTDCGEDTLKQLLSNVLNYAGVPENHPTAFKWIADKCGETKTKEIMTDYGFELDLLTKTQRYPKLPYPSQGSYYGTVACKYSGFN